MKEVRGEGVGQAHIWRKSIPNLGMAVAKGLKIGVSLKNLRNSTGSRV